MGGVEHSVKATDTATGPAAASLPTPATCRHTPASRHHHRDMLITGPGEGGAAGLATQDAGKGRTTLHCGDSTFASGEF